MRNLEKDRLITLSAFVAQDAVSVVAVEQFVASVVGLGLPSHRDRCSLGCHLADWNARLVYARQRYEYGRSDDTEIKVYAGRFS